MADYDAQPVNSGTSKGFSFTSQSRIADPFTPANLTWIEVASSVAADWAGFSIRLSTKRDSWGHSGIFFVSIGAASSEVMIANVPAIPGYRSTTLTLFIPVPIAAGSRVAVACSCEAAQTINGQIVANLSSSFDAVPTYTRYESGPYNLSNTAAYGEWTEVDPGSTANTKGSYTEISQTSHTANVLNGDSLDNTYDYFGFMINGNFNTQQRVAGFLCDIATGAASSEVVYAGDIAAYVDDWEASSHLTPLETKTTVATSGTRISARIQSSITDTVDRKRGILLFGAR